MNLIKIIFGLCILFAYTDITFAACNAECKVKFLTDTIKIRKELSKEIVYVCAKNTKDPVHCITYLSGVSMAESSGGWHCNNYNCFGLLRGKMQFDSYNMAVTDWINRYNKYWYTADSASFFYGSKNHKAKSLYCVDEHSSNTQGRCPNGLSISSSVIDKIKKENW